MIKVRIFNEIKVDNAIAVAGFPGMGLVGKIGVDYLIKKLGGKLIASFFCTGFPAHLIVKSNGLASLIKVDVFYAEQQGLKMFLVTSDAQPAEDRYQNELSYEIVKFLKERGVSVLVAGAAYVTDYIVDNRRVFVAGSKSMLEAFVSKARAIPLENGVVSGMNGVIVGWAQLEGIDAACVLGETWKSIVELELVDYGAAKKVLEALQNVFGISLETSELEIEAQRIEKEIRSRLEALTRKGEASREGRESRPYYIT